MKSPLGLSAILNIENDDNYCFLWSILASLQPRRINDLYRDSKYRQYFVESNLEGFDFTIGFKYSDIQEIEKFKNISIIISNLGFIKIKKRKITLLPIEIKKTDSTRVVHLIFYKNCLCFLDN